MCDYEEFSNLLFKQATYDEIENRTKELQALFMMFVKECRKHSVTAKEMNQIKMYIDYILEELPVQKV